MLFANTSGGQYSEGQFYMLVAYTCGWQISLGTTPHTAQKAFIHLWGPFARIDAMVVSKSCKNGKNAQIFTFRTKYVGPLVANQKSGRVSSFKIAQR